MSRRDAASAADTPADTADTGDTADAATDATPAAEPAPAAPLLELRDGLPPVVDTPDALAEAVARLAAGTGPLAVDAERASGHRYSSRAYLIQLRREGAGTVLIDPVPFGTLDALQEATSGVEWILHAATQDLACLREVGLRPAALFDTELAGRLLGFPRVGLATLVEEVLGRRLRKEHSAVDWSRRPLPESWLEYAALDVEALVELRDAMERRLHEAGKERWAREEFEGLLDFAPAVRAEPWRRVSGTRRLRSRRALAAVRELWTLRDEIARERDVTPSRILPDTAIMAAAQALPRDRGALLATAGFQGRGAERYSSRWVAAVRTALELPESELPERAPRSEGPPPPRAWADRDPVAARRLVDARAALGALAERLALPVENLLTPDLVRRAMWTPPAERDRDDLARRIGERLAEQGARPWQIELTADVLADAVLSGESEPAATDADPAASTPEG